MRRPLILVTAGICSSLALAVPAVAHTGSAAATHVSAVAVGDLELLTDPFLQTPSTDAVHVVWMTEFAGDDHVVLTGDGVDALSADALAAIAGGGQAPAGITAHRAVTTQLSRVAEDAASYLPEGVRPSAQDGVVARDVFRHEAVVRGLAPASQTPYRVVSARGEELGASATFRLAPAAWRGEGQRILLTSDHQAMVNTPANLQVAAATIGPIDAVFQAGDLVNVPDRASEWFDDTRGSAWFPVLQGRGGRTATNGLQYSGAPIIQNAPLFSAIGNHEVQGRISGATSLGGGNNSVPREVAETAYEAVAAQVNPTGDPQVRARWIEDNSFSTTTYEEILTLPESRTGGETYYAATVGDVRLVTLYSTRMWRGTANDADPAARTSTSRYQEAAGTLDDPLAQGYGEFIYEGLDTGSAQYAWLLEELQSPQFQDAQYTVVMMHEGPQGLGDNIAPAFTDPERIEERDAQGNLVGVRYEYPAEQNVLLTDVQPLLEEAGVDLVYSGHSHLWNRFMADSGTVFLEASNTGNSYGAFHPLSGRSRPVPGAPWDASNYPAQGNPGGLEPLLPTGTPLTDAQGTPLPFVQSNDHAVFSVLDTGLGQVTTWVYDLRTPDVAPVVLDEFPLGTLTPSPTFADVAAGQPFYADVRWLAELGLARGTVVDDQTLFAPATAMSRQALAAFVYRYAGAGWTPEPGTRTFADVAPDHEFFTAIEWMVAQGLTTGYDERTFGPTNAVSRQAMAAFLHRLTGAPAVLAAPSFTDVPAGSDFADAIAWLETAGITGGYDDGTFRAVLPITRQAMAAFLHRYDVELHRADTAASRG